VQRLRLIAAHRIAATGQTTYRSMFLAARSGVGKRDAGQIEQGRANPSIATLGKLAVSLPVSVPDLITVAEEAKGPVQVVAVGSMPLSLERSQTRLGIDPGGVL